jgi:hypothetical protein
MQTTSKTISIHLFQNFLTKSCFPFIICTNFSSVPIYRQGLSASFGASYSQMISTSISTVPVVGAAFSVGCMAMDASNIASTLTKIQKPAAKAVALHEVEKSFSSQIPATIQYEVEALLGAINDLKERQEEVQRNQQQDLIEKELDELNFL